jgi:hypothetical protein
MAHDADEMPRSSLRSIPPIARPSIPPPPPETSSWSWVSAVGALALACGVAIGAPQFMLWSQQSYGVGAEATEPLEPGPGLHTEIVRDAPLHRMAEPLHEGRKVAVVPRSAVARMDGRPMVFVAERDLKLIVATPVELGATEGEQQRVLSGVSAGQLVVTEGVAMLERQAHSR